MPFSILKSGYNKIFSSDSEHVAKITHQFNQALDADSRNRERSYINWKAYIAIDGGQWEDYIRDKLHANNRHAAQYNIIGPKVDALNGSLVQEKTDLDFKPIEGVRNSLTEGVKTAYYTDSEIGHFHREEEAIIRDGLIYEGCLKMMMSDRHNPLRNIAFRRCLPGYVVKDPYWISDDDYDMTKCWEVFHLHPEEVANKFGFVTPELEQMIKMSRQFGNSYDEYSKDPEELVRMAQKGTLVRVIEEHITEEVNTERLIGQKIDSERWVPFPITDEKAKLEQYMIDNHIDPNTLITSPYKDRIHHVATIAPEAVPHRMLEDGVSKVQPGRLPYYFFSANRALGQSKGIVDDLVDIQRTINKRESKLTDMISTAQGGGKLVNKSLFDGPLERQRFREKANDPSYIEFVEGEELSKEKAIHYINSNQYPSQIINQLMRMWDIVDRVSKVPAALEAISENANESGVLFERKLAVARVNTITLLNRIKDLRKSMAEGYFNQFQTSYNGPQRSFSTSDGKHSIVLNKRVFNKADGKIYIQNRPDQIPRCHVIATESRSSPNAMMRDRAIYSELYNLSAQTNPEYSSFFFELLLQTMDLDEEHKQRLLEISSLQKIRDKQKIRTEIDTLLSTSKQSDFQGVQADVGIQQMLAQLNKDKQQQGEVAQIPEEDIPEEPLQEEGALPSIEEEQAPPLQADSV